MADNTNTWLIHERDLDPNLRLKINGIQTSDGIDMNQYVSKTMLQTELTGIKTAFSENIGSVKRTFEENFYQKSDIISKDSLHLAEIDIQQNARDIKLIRTQTSNLTTGLPSMVQAEITKQLSENHGSGSDTDDTALQTIRDQVNALSNNVSINAANIQTNQNSINNVIANVEEIDKQLNGYRSMNDFIREEDLSPDLIQKINDKSGSGGSSEENSDIVCKQNGPVYCLDKKLKSTYILHSRNICENDEEVDAAKKEYRTEIYDIAKNLLYLLKDGYNYWNDETTLETGTLESCDTPAEDYQRVSITSDNILSTATNAYTIADNLITFSKATELTIGFYGTKFKLIGTVNSHDDTAPTIPVEIDNDKDAELIYNDTTYEAESDQEKIALLIGSNLSIGRHTIRLTIPEKCTLKLNDFMDIDGENAVILKSDDILNDFSGYYFDKQDNWPTVPSTYNIKKDPTLFDLSKKTQDDLYDIESVDLRDISDLSEKIVHSKVNNKLYVLSDNTLYPTSESIDWISLKDQDVIVSLTVKSDDLDTRVKKLEENASSAQEPAGFISLFYGSTIPDGWIVCDGENETPDLTDAPAVSGVSNLRYIMKTDQKVV